MPRHIIMKLLNTKKKYLKTLKETKEKQHRVFRGKIIHTITDFSSSTMESRRQLNIFKVLKENDGLKNLGCQSQLRMKWGHLLLLKSQIYNLLSINELGFSSGSVANLQYRRHRFNPQVGKIPWRRKWQPAPVSLPGESLGAWWATLQGAVKETGHNN